MTLCIIYIISGEQIYILWLQQCPPPPPLYLFVRIGDGGGRAWFLEKKKGKKTSRGSPVAGPPAV